MTVIEKAAPGKSAPHGPGRSKELIDKLAEQGNPASDILIRSRLAICRHPAPRKDGDMKYRKLGRTGFDVSEMAYGLWGMSGWTGSDDEESLASLQLSIDLGCNFFDTAWAYGEG